MATLEQAAHDALTNCTCWVDGAVIVRVDWGYIAVPATYRKCFRSDFAHHIRDVWDIIGPLSDYTGNITYADLRPDDKEWALQDTVNAIQEAELEGS